MKITALIVFVISLSCSSANIQEDLEFSGKNTSQPISDDRSEERTVESKYQISTYDEKATDQIKYHKQRLKELAKDSVFSRIHENLSPRLHMEHKSYFESRPFELLYFVKGSLFGSSGKDIVFLVYDSSSTRISIILFNSDKKQYSDLYRDMKVINGLSEVPCGIGSSQSLDYFIGSEIIYQGDFLKKRPESYYEDPKAKIANLIKDGDLLPDRACITEEELKKDPSNSLCFSTDTAYNNWICMKYNEREDHMITFFKQAFAD